MISLDKRGFSVAVVLVVAGAWVASRLNPTEAPHFPEATSISPGGPENGVLYATVEIIRPTAPHGFEDLPLPRAEEPEEERFDPPRQPSEAWVRKRLCRGDPSMLNKVLLTFESAPDEIDIVLGDALDRCAGTPLCDAAHEWLDGGARSPAAVALYSHALSICALDDVASLADHPNVSLKARRRWELAHRPDRMLGWMRVALEAGDRSDLVELLANTAPETVRANREALLAMVDGGDPASARLVTALVGGVRMFDAGTREERALRLGKGELSPWMLLDPDGGIRDGALDDLITCARTSGESAAKCLAVLSTSDWATARQIAVTLPADRKEPPISSLRRFATPSAIDAELKRFGIDAGWGAPVGEALLMERRALPASFLKDVEGLEDRLLTVGTPALDDVVAIAHRPKTASDSTRVEAWLGDARYVLRLGAGCNVEDPAAVVGFLNVLMREARSDRRYFTFEPLDGRWPLVGALTPEQYWGMADAGLITPIPPHLSTRSAAAIGAE